MIVSDVMTPHAECTSPATSLRDAARRMADLDVGILPVCANDRLVGMLTDRDIAIRGVAEGCDPQQTTVGDVMTPTVVWCYEDQDVHQAVQQMEQHQIRRLAVLNADKRLVGILSLGDVAVKTGDELLCGEALEVVSEPAHPRR